MNGSASALSGEWPAPPGWWARTFAIVAGCMAVAAVLVFGGAQAIDSAYAAKVQACERIGGEIVNWYDCLSPDGRVDDPAD